MNFASAYWVRGWGIRMYYRKNVKKNDDDDDIDDNDEKVKIISYT